MAQETQIGALYQPRGVGLEGERREAPEGEKREFQEGGVYVYLWLIHVEV